MSCKVTVSEHKDARILLTKEERDALSKAVIILDKYDKNGIANSIVEFMWENEED